MFLSVTSFPGATRWTIGAAKFPRSWGLRSRASRKSYGAGKRHRRGEASAQGRLGRRQGERGSGVAACQTTRGGWSSRSFMVITGGSRKFKSAIECPDPVMIIAAPTGSCRASSNSAPTPPKGGRTSRQPCFSRHLLEGESRDPAFERRPCCRPGPGPRLTNALTSFEEFARRLPPADWL